MIDPIKIYYDYCNMCNAHHSLECYDIYNKPVNYGLMISLFKQNKDLSKILDERRPLSYFRCRKCGECYRIDWSNTGFPIPLRIELPVDNFIEKLQK